MCISRQNKNWFLFYLFYSLMERYGAELNISGFCSFESTLCPNFDNHIRLIERQVAKILLSLYLFILSLSIKRTIICLLYTIQPLICCHIRWDKGDYYEAKPHSKGMHLLHLICYYHYSHGLTFPTPAAFSVQSQTAT